MRLSKKSQYACLALIDLAEHGDRGYVKTADIAKRKKIPLKFLEQIFLPLKQAGYVRSARGAGGGHALAKPADQISVAEILRLFDGPLAAVQSVSKHFYEHTPIERAPKLLGVFMDIRDYVAHKMETTRISDLI